MVWGIQGDEHRFSGQAVMRVRPAGIDMTDPGRSLAGMAMGTTRDDAPKNRRRWRLARPSQSQKRPTTDCVSLAGRE